MKSSIVKTFVVMALLALIVGAVYFFRKLDASRREFKVVFMDVGQGDSALIQFETGERMLVDCGASRSVLSALGRNMVFYDRKIDYLLVTHPDFDHYGGCIDVLNSYDVRKVMVNGDDKKGDPYYVEWKTALLNRDTQIISVSTSLQVASGKFEFFSPDPSLVFSKSDANNKSIVFNLEHDGNKYLFTGDMENELENLLVNKYCSTSSTCPLDTDYLKVGHHGSDGSSGELFLEKVSPNNAIISVGKNKYGHPGLRAIRHLERSGAKIWRTDESGDIVFK